MLKKHRQKSADKMKDHLKNDRTCATNNANDVFSAILKHKHFPENVRLSMGLCRTIEEQEEYIRRSLAEKLP